MAIAEKLVEEVVQAFRKSIFLDRACLVGAAHDILSDPALIKRMAEGVGFEVKEKPAKYATKETEWAVYVIDVPSQQEPIRIDKRLGVELARRWGQEHADELNSKERGQ